MTTRSFATVSIRILGLAAIVHGGISAGGAVIMQAIGAFPLQSETISDLHQHDTYYVIGHMDAWVPAAVSLITGVLLLVGSRKLGALLARGMESEK